MRIIVNNNPINAHKEKIDIYDKEYQKAVNEADLRIKEYYRELGEVYQRASYFVVR